MHTVVETPSFLRHAKQAGVSEDERIEIVDMLAADPLAGDIIEGTGGARKVRVARPGAGKSGGYRIITYYAAADVPLYLLDIYGKGEKASLNKAEKNVLAGMLEGIAEAYRKSARERVAGTKAVAPALSTETPSTKAKS